MNEQRIIDELRAMIDRLKSDVRFETGMSLQQMALDRLAR